MVICFNPNIRRSEFLISLDIVANLFAYTKTLAFKCKVPKKTYLLVRKHAGKIRRFDPYLRSAVEKAQVFGEELKYFRLCGQ